MPGQRAADRRSFNIYWPSRTLDAWKRECARRGDSVSQATIDLVEAELARRGVDVRANEHSEGVTTPGTTQAR